MAQRSSTTQSTAAASSLASIQEEEFNKKDVIITHKQDEKEVEVRFINLKEIETFMKQMYIGMEYNTSQAQ